MASRSGSAFFLLLVLAAVAIFFVAKPKAEAPPAPTPEPGPTPGAGEIPQGATHTQYKGHGIYVWEMSNALYGGEGMGWHWVVQTFAHETLAEDHIGTQGVAGGVEALTAAQAWVDAHGGSGGGGTGGGAGGFGQG